MSGILRRRTLAGVIATVVAATAFTFGGAAPAYAGCQSDSAAAVLTIPDSNGMGSERRRYSCSGTYSVNAKASLFEAKGWSGRIYTRDIGVVVFCDREMITFASRHIWSVALSATRLRECR